jgi:GntR family transcriptional repressor for pyruvate dehydrogenase complex
VTTESDRPDSNFADNFPVLDRRSLASDAADHVRGLIRDGALQPGDRLPAERELASRLGVSRPTLREAVRALVVMGLLESRQGAGTFVARGAADTSPGTTITIDLAVDPLGKLFELRLLLEPPSTSRAAAHITRRQLADLRRLLAELEEYVEDPTRFVRVDVEFHRLIHIAGQSELTLAILDAISDLALRGRGLSGEQHGVTERTIGEHRVILEALESGDSFEASAAMTAHLMHIRGTLIGQTT